jgi:hypothetical protein
MVSFTEQEVAVIASYMGYELLRGPKGYLLKRDHGFEIEIVEAASLELIADFLKH